MSERGKQPGFILVGVLIVVVVIALMGATALVAADGEVSAAQSVLRREQARAMAWSGVQAAMAELANQREQLLDGQPPQLTAQWTLFGDAAGAGGQVRLIEVRDGAHASAEAGKLDANTVSADMLAASGAMDGVAADRVIDARGRATLTSVEDVWAAAGIETAGGRKDSSGAAGALVPAGTTDAPADLVTVYAFEPNVQNGLGADGSDARGDDKIFLGDGWRDEFKSVLEDRLGANLATAVQSMLKRGAPTSIGNIVAGLRFEGVPIKDWAAVLDTVTATADPYVVGGIDVLTAPAAVLRTVPGISEDAAEQITRTRDRIDMEARRSLVWLIQQGVLTEDQFQTAVNGLTSRCLQWRVVVEAGYSSARERSIAEPAGLRDRVALEAVVDVSGPRPRLAYLRDITLLGTILKLNDGQAGAADQKDRLEPVDSGVSGRLDLGAALDASSALDMGSDLEMQSDLGMQSDLDMQSDMAPTGLRIEGKLGDEASGDLHFDGMDLQAGLGGRPRIDRGGSSAGAGSADESARVGVDRRIGRWKISRAKPQGAGK